ncbi:hypothetical protein INR49_018369 [Caranx melampygus]|nr:hypothetical protein INR49_018369 [Caranx melampygus]
MEGMEILAFFFLFEPHHEGEKSFITYSCFYPTVHHTCTSALPHVNKAFFQLHTTGCLT